MKIKYKILFLIVLPLLGLAAYQVYSYTNLAKDVEQVKQTMLETSTHEAGHLANIRFFSAQIPPFLPRAVLLLRAGDKERLLVVIQENRRVRREMVAELDELKADNEKFRRKNPADKTKSLLDMVEGKIKETDRLNEEITREIEGSRGGEGDTRRITKTIEEQLLPLYDQQERVIAEVLESELKEVLAAQEVVRSVEQEGYRELYASSAIFLVLFILIGVFLNFKIVGAVEQITKDIERISQGDLTVEVKGKERRDEVGKLAQAFDRTIVSLKLAMKKVKTTEREFKEGYEKKG